MILDTSALIAILREEPEALTFLEAMRNADTVRLSAATWLELTVVLTRAAEPEVAEAADALLSSFGVVIEDVTRDIGVIARDGYREFGRGTGARAKLNFGDCFAYALAKATDEPLLFKGEDFSKTDIRSAVPR